MSELRLYSDEELAADGYPPQWHATIKHAVRNAAADRCIRCLHPYRRGEHGRGEWTPCDERCMHEGPWRSRPSVFHEWAEWESIEKPPFARTAQVQARWRILTVHHLDGNKANCRWWNLAALCQRCHLTIQGRVRMERVYPWPHSDWFKPYVAGYYAWAYLGEELDREQTELRLDELLGLELAA